MSTLEESHPISFPPILPGVLEFRFAAEVKGLSEICSHACKGEMEEQLGL